MSEPRPKSKRKRVLNRVLYTGLFLLVVAGLVYWYFETETFSATKDRDAAFTVQAPAFIAEFRKNDSLSNVKYREKIITVEGIVAALENPDTATVNIKFVDTTTGDYAIFAFQEQYKDEAKTVKVGDKVSIKGSCSGSSFSEILETYVIPFKRSTIIKR